MFDFDIWDMLGIGYILKTFDKKGEDKMKMFWKRRKEDKKEIDVSKALKTYQFVPSDLSQFISQESCKEIIRVNLQKIILYHPVHFLFSSNQGGTGKTCLSKIIAHQLGFTLHSFIGGDFTLENLKQFLISNEKNGIPSILFIDELHSTRKKILEYLYPLLDGFKLKDISVRPFVFCGATTQRYILQEKASPLISRCAVDICLEDYKPEEIEKIIFQYNTNTYKTEISDEVYNTLSKSSRLNPRLAINLYEDYIITTDLQKVLSMHKIIRNSLTEGDIKILKQLAEAPKGLSLESLAMLNNQSIKDFLNREAYLIQQEYLVRTFTGRRITEKGRAILKEIQNEK